jgi:hypothetical protein
LSGGGPQPGELELVSGLAPTVSSGQCSVCMVFVERLVLPLVLLGSCTHSGRPVSSVGEGQQPSARSGAAAGLVTLRWRRPEASPCAPANAPRWDEASVRVALLGEQWRPTVASSVPSGDGLPNGAKVVTTVRPSFRNCYDDLLQIDSEAEGTSYLACHVDCTGRVVEVSAAASALPQSTVECLVAAVAQARFESPAGGWANVRIPVRLARDVDALRSPDHAQ